MAAPYPRDRGHIASPPAPSGLRTGAECTSERGDPFGHADQPVAGPVAGRAAYAVVDDLQHENIRGRVVLNARGHGRRGPAGKVGRIIVFGIVAVLWLVRTTNGLKVLLRRRG